MGRYSYQIPSKGSRTGTITTYTNSIMQLALAERHREMCESYTHKAKDTGKGYDYSPLYNTSAIYGYSTDVFTSSLETIGDMQIGSANMANNINGVNSQAWQNSINSAVKSGENIKAFSKSASNGLVVVGGIIDVGSGIYENVSNGESEKKIVVDAVVDASAYTIEAVVISGATTLISTAVSGAAIGSAVPGLGTVVGFVGGLVVGLAITYTTDILEVEEGKTVKDKIKESFY